MCHPIFVDPLNVHVSPQFCRAPKHPCHPIFVESLNVMCHPIVVGLLSVHVALRFSFGQCGPSYEFKCITCRTTRIILQLRYEEPLSLKQKVCDSDSEID